MNQTQAKNSQGRYPTYLTFLAAITVLAISLIILFNRLSYFTKLNLVSRVISQRKSNGRIGTVVTVFPINQRQDLFLALTVWDRDWDDYLYLVSVKHNSIQWIKEINPDPGTSRGIFQVKILSLPGFKQPLIQFYDRTHMGNGFYYVYEIRPDHPVQILQTFAVDSNWEMLDYPSDPESQVSRPAIISSLIRGDHFRPRFKELSKDEMVEITLAGHIDYYFGEDDPAQKTGPVGTAYWKKVYCYDKTKGKFVMDAKRSFYRSRFKYRAYYVQDNTLN